MNARVLRRSLLSAGIAVIVIASVYAATGISSAASSPQSPRAGAVRTIPVQLGVMNKAGKAIWHGTGVASIVRLGSAAQAGAAGPDGVEGPNTYCYANYHVSYSIGSGGSVIETIAFPSGPFVVGYEFNESTQEIYAEVSEYQSGDVVKVTVLNNGPYTETLAGSAAVLYTDRGC